MADIKKIKIGNDELDVTKKQDKIDSTHKLSADLVDDSSSTHKFTTAADISKLSGIEAGAEANVQSDWSQTTTTADDYIKNKPTIGNATLTIQKNSTTIDTFTANATSNKTINIPIPTTAADVSALPASTKYGASISVSVNSTDYKITTTLKDQNGNTLGTAQVVDLPLESVVVSGSFDSTNKKIILALQNGNTVDIPVGDLVAGLQTEITSENKLDSDLVDDTDQAHKFMTAAERTKLSGIATGAEVNVQSDWNVTENTSDAFIKNKPTIDSALSNSSTNAVQNKVVKSAIDKKVDVANIDLTGQTTTLLSLTKALGTNSIHYARWFSKTDGGSSGISDKPTGSTNASFVCEAKCSRHNTTSDYTYQLTCWVQADSNPYIAVVKHDSTSISWSRLKPTVNNATLTIQKNGTTVQTFTANQSTAATANITVPTKTSDITNDSGFVTGSITKADSGTLGTTTIGSTTANYMEVTKLSTATDLNTIKTTGVYIIAATPTNSPTGAWGTMYVDWTAGTKYQVYINDGVSGNIFKRSWDSSNSTWTSWVRITSADIANIERYYRSLVPVGTAIAANKNLNTTEFLKVGKYYCSTNATVATLTNCPTGTAFMMEVFSPLSTTIDNETTGTWVYRMRVITELDGDMWYQGCNSNATANNWYYGTWNKIARIADIDTKPNSYWGTCTTAADTAAKVVTVASAQNFKLIPGAMITFKAPNTNTAQNPTINVNSTGAKPVFYNSAVVTTSNLNKAGQNGRPATYVYDGTNWVWISWSTDDNTTYSTMSVSEGTTGTATNARTVRADYLKQIIEHYIPDIVDMTGATSSTAGAHGLVPAPAAGDNTKFLRGDGTWQTAGGGGDSTITYYLNGNVLEATGIYTTSSLTTAVSEDDLIEALEESRVLLCYAGDTIKYWPITIFDQDSGSYFKLAGEDSYPSYEFSYVNSTNNIEWGTARRFQDKLTAGSHINISNNKVISAVNYVHSENPVAASQASTISGSQITNGSIDATKLAQGSVLTLQTTTTDPGEGAALPANTLLGVYNLPHEYKSGELLAASQNTTELSWNGTTCAFWGAGIWTQYGRMKKTTNPAVLQITNPTSKPWIVEFSMSCSTVNVPANCYIESGLCEISLPTTISKRISQSIISNNGGSLNIWTSYSSKKIVTIPAGGTKNIGSFVRTSSSNNAVWKGGDELSGTDSNTNFGGASCILEAKLIDDGNS